MVELSKHKKIHFLGIGGAGMSPIAKLLIKLGYTVSGTDIKESTQTIRLRNSGAKVYIGHQSSQVREADVVVVSTAISEENEELQAAKDGQIPILHRSEMLDFIMSHYLHRISIAGTHGKTTTSGLLTCLFWSQNQKPTFVVGSDIQALGTNADLGTSGYVIAESDESDGSFLNLKPTVAIFTNLEEEHMNFFKTREALINHFSQFMAGIIARDGYLIINADDEVLLALSQQFPKDQIKTYGFSGDVDILAETIQFMTDGTQFDIRLKNGFTDTVKTQLYGTHNVSNALACYLCAYSEGMSRKEIKEGLLAFTGTKRRMQLIGDEQDIAVFDDYAHHPTEISTTLKGLKASLNRPVYCVFQPHRYTRTRDCLDGFIDCFEDADVVIVTDVYAASESPIAGVNSEVIVERLHQKGKTNAFYIHKKSDVPSFLLSRLIPGDCVITMGAGDVHLVSKELVVRLKKHDQEN